MADHNLTTTAVSATTTTLTTLRSRLRVELHDEDSANYRWTDATLNRHLERAVRDLSLVAPRERASTLATTLDSRDLSTSTLDKLVNVLAVEYPVGEYPPVYVQFSHYGGLLSLLVDTLPGASEDVGVYWGQLHTLDASSSTLKPPHEDVVVLGASGYAALEWANFAVNRANVAGDDAFQHYRRWGSDQIVRFGEALQRLRESSRVKAGTIFTPAAPVPSRNIVRWEP